MCPMKVRKHKYSLLITILLLVAQLAEAQHAWHEITGGLGLSYATKERSSSSYTVRVLPTVGLTSFIPFSERIALKTGAIYQYKGISSSGRGTNRDSAEFSYTTQSTSSYHFINIPLQLAVNIGNNKQGFWRVAGGMSYGFLVAARKQLDFQTYKDNHLIRTNSLRWKPIIGSEQSGNTEGLPGDEGTPLHFFVPALRADITYQWQERLLISAFYEYNLQDVRVRTVGNSVAKLHYTGLSFGVLFW